MQINKILLVLLLFFFYACTSEVKEKVVSVDEAKKDGFEIIVFSNNIFKTVEYKTVSKLNEKNFYSYLIPSNKIKTLSKVIKRDTDTSKYTILTNVDEISDFIQNICLEFHYTKSTYTYCYEVNRNKVIPKYSKYHDFSKNEKVIYK